MVVYLFVSRVRVFSVNYFFSQLFFQSILFRGLLQYEMTCRIREGISEAGEERGRGGRGEGVSEAESEAERGAGREGVNEAGISEAGISEAGIREWYVRLENLYLNDSCVGYKRIITYRDSELMDRILSHYSLPLSLRSRMRIWSSPFRMRRLSPLTGIPEEHVFLSVDFY
jgi:hypothetical protein